MQELDDIQLSFFHRVVQFPALTTFLVIGPKYPVAGRPWAAWNFLRAVKVEKPKKVVSFPIAPEPLEETGKPWVLRYCWRALTSWPVEPSLRSREKVG